MIDRTSFSAKLLASPEAASDEALERISIAKRRIQSVLDRETVAHQKTLEQKIAEQGPMGQRVDPHLIGLALLDLLEQDRLARHTHPATKKKPWYANLATTRDAVQQRLDHLAPLYARVSGSGFGNLTGDALEVVVYRCLDATLQANPRYLYQGYFLLDRPKNNQGRFRKVQPPKVVGSHSTEKEADFLQYGYAQGGLCIECKNYREWIYPHHGIIRELIIKATELNLIPVLIARRLHYTTRTNLFEPAGIIAHEAYHQYYPSTESELATEVRHKRSLGFTDILATEEPHPRTQKFFLEILPRVVPYMAERWNANRANLLKYALGEINLAQLYTAIDSPAGGKWIDHA